MSTFFVTIRQMNLVEVLDKLYYGLKFKDAVYIEKENKCVANFLYNPASFTPDEENKTVILNKLKDVIGSFVKIELDFTSCPLDKRSIANHVYTTIVNIFPAISKNFTYDDVSVEIDAMKVYIKLRLSPSAYKYAHDLNREELVANKLSESFLADFVVEFQEKPDEIGHENVMQNTAEFYSSIKEAEEKVVYKLSEVTNIIGKNDYTLANDFTKIKTEIENVAVCGTVSGVQKRSFKKTYTKNGESKEIEKYFYTFTIANNNKFLRCSIFPKQSDEQKGELIEDGMKVCCFGSFKDYKGRLDFTANSIARCEYEREEIKTGFKHVNEEYHTVFPEEFVDFEQTSVFDEEKNFPGSYVVFDLETTGLDGAHDEIIEIGACKIIDGKIVELFSTFVNPNKHISKEITELTGITNDMVKDAPTINYVLPDFYKFCYGSTIVGHNVQFDMSFIYTAGRKFAYNFDNPLMDTLEMARKKVPGLRNYKLGTVAEKLSVSLENAHRAVHDATATAKVFIKLM